MKRTAIITWITYPNFGTYLQAFALQKYIKSLGYENKILNDAPYTSKFSNWKYELKKALWMCTSNYRVFARSQKESLKLYERFKLENIDLENNASDKSYLNSYYDCFICGSDQIWSPLSLLNNPNADFYFASFATKEKIAYAPSIGLKSIPDKLKYRYVELIKGFKALSAREPQGQQILYELSVEDVVKVVDPTLLLSKEDWERLLALQEQAEEEKYVLAYFLTPNPIYMKVAKEYARSHKCKFKMFFMDRSCCYFADELIVAGPIEFLMAIKNAGFIFTDSFHGSIFAYIFNVQFVTFKRFKDQIINQNSRVENLLRMMDIPEHLIDEDNLDFISELPVIDFRRVEKSLEPFINTSKQYLQKALSE